MSMMFSLTKVKAEWCVCAKSDACESSCN